MAKVSATVVNQHLREDIFHDIFFNNCQRFDYQKINDRQYGVLMIDENGEERYIKLPAIVADIRDDMTAQELMQSEIDAYNQKQADKAEKAKKKADKIAKDKAKREAKEQDE